MFANRIEAGRCLGQKLSEFELENPVVLGLPRGGVPVAAEVARVLNAPLDVIVVRKLGVPLHPEYAMGAIGEGDVCVVDWRVVANAGVTATQLTRVIGEERFELRRMARRFRGSLPRLDLSSRAVIIVDDGIATGSTATAAIRVARDLEARRVILASPIAPAETGDLLRRIADDLVLLETPDRFDAVGQAYADFTQTSDEEVISTLQRTRSGLQSKKADLTRSA